MENTLIHEFIVIAFLFCIVAYTKQLLDFSTTLLGKITSVAVILYYTSIDKLYGLLAAAILIYIMNYSWTIDLDHQYANYVRDHKYTIGDTYHVIDRNRVGV